jgi:hypothetical protein
MKLPFCFLKIANQNANKAQSTTRYFYKQLIPNLYFLCNFSNQKCSQSSDNEYGKKLNRTDVFVANYSSVVAEREH